MRRLALSVLPFTTFIATSAWAEIIGQDLLAGDLRWTARNLTYTLLQQPSDTARDLGFSSNYPENVIQNDLRVDLSWARGPVRIGLKPRADLFWQSWTSGPRSGQDEASADLYFYEWSGRVSLSEKVQAEYGLINLQWGPSFLLSPSNPFDSRNGESNPKLELPPAADYGLVTWFPTSAWTITLIANVDEGRKGYLQEFHPTYALKVDYVFRDGYASLIASYRDEPDRDSDEPTNTRLGYYAGYNLTDRLLGYVEGSSSEHDSENLLGLSYTTPLGPTMVLEYFHNSNGSDGDIRQLLLRPDEVDWREALFRKNYLLLQAYQRNLWGRFDYVLRWVTSPDDDSHSANVQLDLGVSDMVTLFTVATTSIGDDGDESVAARDYQVMAGIEVAF
jgi:hypothetical protein